MGVARENIAPTAAQPAPVLELRDTIALIVGVVVGAGIFKTPSLVAANAGGAWTMLGAWLRLTFCASSAWLLYSSLAYTRMGALVGVAVLVAGVPLLALAMRRNSSC